MENILHDFNKKIITLIENYLKNLIFSKGIASFTEDLVAEFAQFGSELSQFVIEYTEEQIFKLDERKERFESLEKDSRSIVSIFGEIRYERRYYKNKENNEKVYLVDKFLGIESKQRILKNVKENLIKEAIDSSYEKAGKNAAYGVVISRQEVKNEIEKLDLDKEFYTNNKVKKQVKNLYVIADEDHVHLQKGGIEEPRMVIVYDGILQKGKRVELKNKRHFGGLYKGRIDDLWEEVSLYIEENYDLKYLENVFIQGDGASWIKTGVEWIHKSKYVIDGFHLSKAINGIVGRITKKNKKEKNENKRKIRSALQRLKFKEFKEICCEIISEEMEETLRDRKIEMANYILNNKEGIINLYENKELLHGCSAEGHISHILSDRLSSRPMGWKTKNVDNMSKLRLLREDGISVKEILLKQEKVIEIDEYKEIKEKARKKINVDFRPVSMPIITFGTKEEKEYFRRILNNIAV